MRTDIALQCYKKKHFKKHIAQRAFIVSHVFSLLCYGLFVVCYRNQRLMLTTSTRTSQQKSRCWRLWIRQLLEPLTKKSSVDSHLLIQIMESLTKSLEHQGVCLINDWQTAIVSFFFVTPILQQLIVLQETASSLFISFWTHPVYCVVFFCKCL